MGVVGRLDQYASMLATEFDDYSMSENLVTDAATDYNYSFNNQIVATTTDVAPDGMTVLCKHNLTGATSPFLNCRANTTLSSGNTYTMSMWLKGTTSFSASFAFVGETTNEIYSNTANITTTWQRFTLTFTLIATQTLSRLQLFFATQGEGKIVSVWEAQLERGSVATDYTSRKSGTQVIRVLSSTTNTNITGLGTYYSSGFDENVGFTTFLPANVFAPYDPVYDEFGGTLFGAGQGRYMRQYTDKSAIVYNEIDEVSDFRDIVRTGLVLDLDAAQPLSYKGTGTAWNDLSGTGNNGTLINMDGTNFSSSNGGYLTFDATNEYITSTFSTTSGQAVTYAGWLYSTETVTYRNFVDSITARPMIWWNNSGQIEFDAAFYTTPAVYRNQWVYVALSKPSGSSSASYYVNGVLVGTGSAYTTPALTPTWFNRAAGQTWRGNCSNVQAYNRALTAAEIQQNYNALKHRFGL